ncbi:putative copper resistance protein D [Tessaracoccus bendigoensis DSM 12906]|uniref:Putative copper resistance protein D n=2 Tax=Tessaracoccus TaxID=72763 RepID=A0A1M6AUN7_9ACTN|nr:putative copper resistance protein D [Tessaracoccus bendigoensis DSM 12906]
MRHMFAGVMAAFPMHANPDDDIVPLRGWRYLTAWDFPLVAVLALLVVGGLYLWGVHRLKARGDSWPVMRTISFVGLGLGSIAVATFSFLGVYDTVLFWSHMVQHMLLNMIAPVFLVFGAPVTLALRTLPKRPRGLLLKVLHSGFAKVLLFPPLTTGLMVASPFLLYMTGWYELTLRNDFFHDMLHLYLVTVGCLFFFPLLGVDPVPIKMPYPIRILLFMLTMPFHAFLGVTIMGSTRLIAEDWYVAFDRSWGLSPMSDQNWAGGLLWATGDLTMFAAMGTIFIQWIRESNREAKRIDRQLDREEAAQARSGRPGYDDTSKQPRPPVDSDNAKE